MASRRFTNARWGFPMNSRKAHLYLVADDGKPEIISLCGKWMFAGAREDDPWKGESDPGKNPDDCRACVKKVLALDKKLER